MWRTITTSLTQDTFVWRKIEPKIVSVEKKGQLSYMLVGPYGVDGRDGCLWSKMIKSWKKSILHANSLSIKGKNADLTKAHI